MGFRPCLRRPIHTHLTQTPVPHVAAACRRCPPIATTTGHPPAVARRSHLIAPPSAGPGTTVARLSHRSRDRWPVLVHTPPLLLDLVGQEPTTSLIALEEARPTVMLGTASEEARSAVILGTAPKEA
jgi:hypothetical protein